MQSILIALTIGCLLAIGLGRWLGVRVAQASRERAAESAAAAALHKEGGTVSADALSHYLAKIQSQARTHEAVFEQLNKEKIFSWSVHSPADLEHDAQLVKAFQSTNDQLIDGLQYGADFIRAELNTARVPAAERDAILARYTKMAEPLLPLQMRVRNADKTLGENALAILNLLNLNWGEWTRDKTSGRLNFNNSITLVTFRDYADKLAAAASEREQAQKELDQYLEHNRQQ